MKNNKNADIHLSFKPEFPYDNNKWEPIGSYPVYSKHMPFNTLCSLSGSPLVSIDLQQDTFFFFLFAFSKIICTDLVVRCVIDLCGNMMVLLKNYSLHMEKYRYYCTSIGNVGFTMAPT